MTKSIASTEPDQSERSGAQFATFYVDGLFFGIDVLNVQEVLRQQDITRVPQAPSVIEGLINLRGQIVMAIDMRRRMDLLPRDETQAAMNMVVRTQEGAISLLVDEIGDVLEVDHADFERPPSNLPPSARNLIRGIYKLKDRLLLVLDTERTVDVGQQVASDRRGPTVDGLVERRRRVVGQHVASDRRGPTAA